VCDVLTQMRHLQRRCSSRLMPHSPTSSLPRFVGCATRSTSATVLCPTVRVLPALLPYGLQDLSAARKDDAERLQAAEERFDVTMSRVHRLEAQVAELHRVETVVTEMSANIPSIRQHNVWPCMLLDRCLVPGTR